MKIIVGNKVDKEMFGRQVGKEEGAEFARKMGCLFVGELDMGFVRKMKGEIDRLVFRMPVLECSAKTKVGVEEAFRDLVLRVRIPHFARR